MQNVLSQLSMTHIFVFQAQFNENNLYLVYIDAKQKKRQKIKLQDDNTKAKNCFYFNITYKKSQEYFKRTKNKYLYVKKMQEHKN